MEEIQVSDIIKHLNTKIDGYNVKIDALVDNHSIKRNQSVFELTMEKYEWVNLQLLLAKMLYKEEVIKIANHTTNSKNPTENKTKAYLTSILKHFEELEEYEKCARVKKMLDQIQ